MSSVPPQPAVDDALSPPVDELARLSFEVMGRLSRLAAEGDMSLTQLRMLAILRDRRPRMAELAAALGVDRSSVSGLIARAERRNLVSRIPAAGDGRGFMVALTDAGQEFAAALEHRTSAALSPLLSDLDPSEQRAFRALLAKVVYR